MAVQKIGKDGPIFGIPEWLGKALGIQAKMIQDVNLRFSNESFCEAEIKLVPEAGNTLQHLLEDTCLMFCRKGSFDA